MSRINRQKSPKNGFTGKKVRGSLRYTALSFLQTRFIGHSNALLLQELNMTGFTNKPALRREPQE
jgi:hypothetical protein